MHVTWRAGPAHGNAVRTIDHDIGHEGVIQRRVQRPHDRCKDAIAPHGVVTRKASANEIG